MQTNSKKITRAAAVNLAKRYIEQCEQRGLPIRKAVLFGSVVTNTAGKESDIDLLLVSDAFIADSLHNWKLLAPITAKYYDIEPHPYPTNNFLKGDPFLNEVLKHGIEIKRAA